MTKLFSHTSNAIHTDHHHHTYESPKQYYSIQLSHTFNNDNIVLPFTNITTANSLANFHVPRMWLAKHTWLFLTSISYKLHHCLAPTTSNSVLAACGVTVLVSGRPFKFHRFAQNCLHRHTHSCHRVSNPWLRTSLYSYPSIALMSLEVKGVSSIQLCIRDFRLSSWCK